MSLDIFFAEDVRNALMAAYESRDKYSSDYVHALNVIALSFGLPRVEAISPQITFEGHATYLVSGSPIRLGE